MKNNLYKSDHFHQRAWERGINQYEIDQLLMQVSVQKDKVLAVFGKEKLKMAGIKLDNKSHLVIVIKENVLVTLFDVPDLFQYMKSSIRKTNFIIL